VQKIATLHPYLQTDPKQPLSGKYGTYNTDKARLNPFKSFPLRSEAEQEQPLDGNLRAVKPEAFNPQPSALYDHLQTDPEQTLSSEYGTCKTDKARSWLWLSGKSP